VGPGPVCDDDQRPRGRAELAVKAGDPKGAEEGGQPERYGRPQDEHGKGETHGPRILSSHRSARWRALAAS
jgi:hypothetical protein